MFSLSKPELMILAVSTYTQPRETRVPRCDVCREAIFAGQLRYTNGQDWMHTRCVVRRPNVHYLHQLVQDYRQAGGR